MIRNRETMTVPQLVIARGMIRNAQPYVSL
jgi:hypothetical protein